MLLDPFSRFFVKYDLTLKPWYERGAALKLVAPGEELGALDVVRALFDKGEAVVEIKAGDIVRLSVIDLREKDDLLILLFRRRNANATTQMFEHEETNDVRAADRKSKEHPAVSAHLIIDLRQQQKKEHPTYRVLLEEVPGLGLSYVMSLLSRAIASHHYEAANDKGVPKQTHTIARFEGLPSQTLGAAVGKGGIDFIELVRPAKTDGLDDKGLAASPERLKLSVQKGAGVSPLELLKRVRDWSKQNDWPDVRVQIRNEHDRSKVVRLQSEADAAATLFVQGELVTVKTPLPDCAQEVNDELVAAARKFFDSDKKWQ